MSNNQPNNRTGSAHPPKKLLWATLFVLPAVIVIGTVAYFAAPPAPQRTDADTIDPALAVAQRIEPVGRVHIQQGERVLQAGADVYKAQCMACHAAGLVGAPKFGDASAWGPRLGQGLDMLVQNTLKGKGAMGAQGGGMFSDLEIARAVVYLANAGGASFTEPAPPAAEGVAAAPADAAAPAQ